jgi:hypothetical protein
MIRTIRAGALAAMISFVLVGAVGPIGLARGGEPTFHRGRQGVVVRARPRYLPGSTATLGNFQPTPYIWVGGSYPTGSGYSPMDTYGDQTLSLYGPLSPLRVSSAPVLSYARGYDGRLYPVETSAFSYPNLPAVSPVVYPSEANYYYGPRVPRTPRWGSSAINWIDQN